MVQCFASDGQIPDHAARAVSWNEPGIIGKTLDRRRVGYHLPDGEHGGGGEGARLTRRAYPPKGKRSNGPIRAAAYRRRRRPYQTFANDEVLVTAMIETQEALDNIDAILDVPGVSGIYIGPSDLGFSLGLKPVLDREEPQVHAIYEKLLQATSKRGLFAGIHNATGAYAARMIAMGFRFVTLANDSGLMARAARAEIDVTRKTAGDIAK